MVQVLPSREQSFLQSLFGGAAAGAEATGKMLPQLQQMQQQKQRAQDYSKALGGIEKIYANPDLTEQQKLISAYKELGSHPELAPHLGSQLTRAGAQQESFKDKLMKQQQLDQSFQKIQQMYADPNLTDEQKVFGVYQELAQNPTLAASLTSAMQKPAKTRGEDIAGQQYARGYDAIVSGDTSALNEVLHDPETSYAVKRQLTDLRDKYETRKGVQSRELRQRQSMVQKSYKQAIEAQKKILDNVYTDDKEKPAIRKEIKRLEALEKHDLKKLTKNPDSYPSLALWNNLDPDYFPEETEEEEELFTEREQPAEEKSDVDERVEFLNGTFPPLQFKGKKKQDKSGRVYESDGKTWRLVQG